MLTKEGCERRRRLLIERCPDFDLLVLSHPAHIFYLSGFLVQPAELASWGINFLLIDSEGHSRLLADNWAARAAHAAFVDDADVWAWYDFSVPAEEKYLGAAKRLASTLRMLYPGLERVAVDHGYIPLAAAEALDKAQTFALEPILLDMRRSKDEDELVCIRRAVRATELGQATARIVAQPGVREIDVFAEIQSAIIRAAGESIAMLGEVAAGRRSEKGGGPPSANVLEEGDLVIVDLFPVVGGYRADISNTLCVGDPSKEQRDHITVLQSALEAAEATLAAGVTGDQVYEVCRQPIAEAGLAGAFPHHAGHGLGLWHPEPPYLVAGSQDVLRAGDVLTLEPGAYLPGWGGARIEHNYLITEAGFERLSNHRIEL